MGWRDTTCKKCGATVKIPWLWIFGLEMIFYCRECRQYCRINYKLGALLAGIGWALALVSIQLVAYFTTAFTITLAAILFFPLGFLYSFLLRRFTLRRSRLPRKPAQKD